jgi:hypothetical protein
MLTDPVFSYVVFSQASEDPQFGYLYGLTKMVSFSTDILGGYMDCEFVIPLPTVKVLTNYRKLLGDNLVLRDWLGDYCFTGRIEDAGLVPEGIRVTALGWYSATDDETSGLIYTQGSGTSVSDIVADAVALISDWNQTTGFIRPTTTDLTALEALDFTGETKIREMVEHAVKFGSDDTPPRPLQFGVWERRIAKMSVVPDVNITMPKYYLFSNNAVNPSVTTSVSRKDIYNRIQGLYNDPDVGQAFTDWADDLPSQKEFGVREGSINIGQGGLSLAELARDLALKQYAQPKPIVELTFQGTARNVVGSRHPIHKIVAGDVVAIIDVDPFIASAIVQGASGGHGPAKFVVKQTRYDSSSNTISLDVAERSTAMERMLASIGLGVGGIS